jgi:hypothetical protein
MATLKVRLAPGRSRHLSRLRCGHAYHLREATRSRARTQRLGESASAVGLPLVPRVADQGLRVKRQVTGRAELFP